MQSEDATRPTPERREPDQTNGRSASSDLIVPIREFAGPIHDARGAINPGRRPGEVREIIARGA